MDDGSAPIQVMKKNMGDSAEIMRWWRHTGGRKII
jgi:hypothetical protein